MFTLLSLCMCIIGIFMICIHAVKRSCPPDQIVIKYKDMTFEQEQNNLQLPTDLYWNMFHARTRTT